MHHLIQDYFDNQAAYHRNEWALMVFNKLEVDTVLDGRKDPLFLAVEDFLKPDAKKLWKQILESLEEIPIDELNKLVDAMPSGWARAKIMDFIEQKTFKSP